MTCMPSGMIRCVSLAFALALVHERVVMYMANWLHSLRLFFLSLLRLHDEYMIFVIFCHWQHYSSLSDFITC
jgi:ABC-type phosphate/phosphonate transport system permease subunit